jgi:hypothetical protein
LKGTKSLIGTKISSSDKVVVVVVEVVEVVVPDPGAAVVVVVVVVVPFTVTAVLDLNLKYVSLSPSQHSLRPTPGEN